MALAGHHVKSTSFLSHRHRAVHVLARALDHDLNTETFSSVLDCIVILFSLDVSSTTTWFLTSLRLTSDQETQAILGNWNTHLRGAYTLLETHGGISSLALSSRFEAQIGILLW